MKMQFGISFLLIAVLATACAHKQSGSEVAKDGGNSTVSYPAYEAGRWPASDCPSQFGGFKSCKQARRNDSAMFYGLSQSGDLYRLTDSGTKCQLTNNVESFKVSQHPNDQAMAYYVRAEGGQKNLYVVNNAGDSRGDCPPALKKKIMDDVKEYGVVSNQNTTIVNAEVAFNGVFEAWDNARLVYRDTNIKDFQMNPCYGSQGKSFNSYVLFTLDNTGHIQKVKVSDGAFHADQSKQTRETFDSVSQFISKMNVCK